MQSFQKGQTLPAKDVCEEHKSKVAITPENMNSRTLTMVRNLGCFSVYSPIKTIFKDIKCAGSTLLKEGRKSKKTFGA
jgi:hypothetical protein